MEEAFEDSHEAFANSMLAVVFVHIAEMVVSSFAHRENLVGAMFSGRKAGTAAEGIVRRRGLVALLLAGALAGIWTVGLGVSPATLPGLDMATAKAQAAYAEAGEAGGGDRRDDQDDDN